MEKIHGPHLAGRKVIDGLRNNARYEDREAEVVNKKAEPLVEKFAKVAAEKHDLERGGFRRLEWQFRDYTQRIKMFKYKTLNYGGPLKYYEKIVD